LVLQRVTETQINAFNARQDGRLAALGNWLDGIDAVAGARLEPASADASFRRYFRLRKGTASFIVMDAPPAREDSRPFIRIAGYLESMRLNAPRVVDANLEDGFLLLTDLGSMHYLENLSHDPAAAGALYEDALRALGLIQSRGVAFQSHLPPYDEQLLRFELSLFHDWLCEKHLGIRFDSSDESQWQELCKLLVSNALDQPQVFVHRDYHSRNLMVTRTDNPGILDFQDAVEGPLTYDLVSLLRDCYISWAPEQVAAWRRRFYEAMDEGLRRSVSPAQFERSFDLMGVQRHLKAAGIFARLNHRDGKPGYMADVPRTLQYIVDLGPAHAELDFLVRLISGRCLPALAAG
jgi:N-acetylmuramate 1-kinase